MHYGSKWEQTCLERCVFADIAECLEEEAGVNLARRISKLGKSMHRSFLVGTGSQFGMHDLVSTCKVSGTHSNEHSFVHFAAGVNTSSAASIATYITDLSRSLPQCKQGWFPKMNECKITKAVYCCFAPLSKCDIRVEVKFPGTVRAFSVNEFGQYGAVTEDLWNEAFVFSTMRLFALNSSWREENPVQVLVRKVNPFPVGSNREDEFLAACVKFLSNKEFCALLFEGFSQLARIGAVTRFFGQQNLPELGGFQIRGMFQLNQIEEAFRLLASNVKQCANRKMPSTHAFIGAIQFLLDKRDYKNVVAIGEVAVRMNPTSWKCWLLLVRGLIGTNQYARALHLLNSIPNCEDFTEQPTSTEVSNGLQSGVFFPEKQTLNRAQPTGKGEAVEDFLLSNSSYFLRKKDKFITESYALLCLFYHQLGWDSLLQVRSEVFAMLDEPANVGQKLVCEQWLDELFLVLYEDIKIYTVWKAEATCFRERNLEYTRNVKEWEILGTIAGNLRQPEEAIYAFQSSLEQQFSIQIARKLALLFLEQERQVNFLLLIARIIEYQDLCCKESMLEPEVEFIGRALQIFGSAGTISTINSISNNPLVRQIFEYIAHQSETFPGKK